MNEHKKEEAAKHIEKELCMEGTNMAYEVRCMLDAYEKAVIDRVLEIIDKEDYYFDQLIRRGEVADLDDIYERMRDAVLALRG
ncbi:MAG: hypothetical protein IJP92_00675 [Lachnospiraceae bacterium]|nr:hypothetical protein [Lachnospiraceae bacterium]